MKSTWHIQRAFSHLSIFPAIKMLNENKHSRKCITLNAGWMELELTMMKTMTSEKKTKLRFIKSTHRLASIQMSLKEIKSKAYQKTEAANSTQLK